MPRDKSTFHFKQFSVRHADSTMKVGTDGVLIGAWSGQGISPGKILDIGTGSGLIALMQAQRFPQAQVTGIEVHPAAATEALLNASQSPFAKRIEIIQQDFTQWQANHLFDLIISNPPYFSSALHSNNQEKNLVRHQIGMTVSHLLEHAVQILSSEGKLSLILPTREMQAAFSHATVLGLHCCRVCEIRSKAGQEVIRIMAEWSPRYQEQITDQLIIYEEDGSYTHGYKMLTKDFYLAF